MLGRGGKNCIELFRRKVVAPLFCELLCRHVVVEPRAIGLQTGTVAASDRVEISPALETSGSGLGDQACQAEESNSLSPRQVFNVRQFMGEDCLDALDGSSPGPPRWVHQDEIAHLHAGGKASRAERGSKVI